MCLSARTRYLDLPGSRERSKRSPSAPALLGGLLLIAAGCGSDGTTNDTGDGEGPLFIAVSTVFNNDDALSYVTPLATLEADQEVDYTRSLEKGAIPRLYADAPPRSRFFLGAGQEPTIESYEVGDGLRAGERLSLLALGVQSFDNAGFILSKDKAYYYDYATSQVIVCDPSTMEVRKTIDVSAVERNGVTAYFAYSNPGLAEGKYLFFNLQYYTGEPDYFPSGGSVLVVVNTETDELENIDVDDRCDAIANWVRTDDGTVWFATGMAAIQNAYFDLGLKTDCLLKLAPDGRGFDKTYVGDLKALVESPIVGTMVKAGPNAIYVKALDEALLLRPELPASCALRIRQGEETIDSDFALDLRAAAGGKPTGLLMPGADGSFWINVWHEERHETPPAFDETNTVEAWRWWRLALPRGEFVEESGSPWHGGSAQGFQTAGRTYTSLVAADYSTAMVSDMNAPEGPRSGIRVRGGLYEISRLVAGEER